MASYSAVSPFQYPEGVVIPGETIDLDDETAAPGLESGALVPTPVPPPSTPVDPPATPAPPAGQPDQSDPKE